MKNFTNSGNPSLILQKGALLFFLLIFSTKLFALSVTINGPSEVCPDQNYIFPDQAYTFTATAKNWYGQTITPSCDIQWRVVRNNVVIASLFNNYGGNGSVNGLSFTYKFDATLGPVEVQIMVANGWCVSPAVAHDEKTVNIRVKTPKPISGPSTMCAGETKAFSTSLNNNFADCHFHHDFIWTIPTGWGLSFNSDNKTNQVSITVPSSASSGTYTIKVKGYYGDELGWVTPERSHTVTVGPPNTSNLTINGPSEICPGNHASFSTNYVAGITNYNWSWPSGWTYLGGQGTRYLELRAPYGNFYGGTVLLNASNQCGGNTTPIMKYVRAGSYCGYMYSVYPNSVSDSFEVLVEKEDPNDKTEELGDLELIFYNDKQQKITHVKTKHKKNKIETKELPDGVYSLHIIHNGEKIIKQVIVKK
jgi:hypothetical protein